MAMRGIEDVKLEAIKRLKILRVHENVIKDFEVGVLNKSERLGMLYWLDSKEQTFVKKFEQEMDALVYHVILGITNIGIIYSLLFVSKNDVEWKMDCDDLRSNQALVYVLNETDPMCSELGMIGLAPLNGGVSRIW